MWLTDLLACGVWTIYSHMLIHFIIFLHHYQIRVELKLCTLCVCDMQPSVSIKIMNNGFVACFTSLPRFELLTVQWHRFRNTVQLWKRKSNRIFLSNSVWAKFSQCGSSLSSLVIWLYLHFGLLDIVLCRMGGHILLHKYAACESWKTDLLSSLLAEMNVIYMVKSCAFSFFEL